MPLRPSTAASILGVIPILIIIGIGMLPMTCNRYMHPIGRMSNRIEVGDSCDEVFKEFQEYVRAPGTDQADSGQSTTRRDLYMTRDVPDSKVIWLYDLSPFDDLQISVRCDPESGAVIEKLVVLD